MSARETLAMFVAGGNMRETTPSPGMAPERVNEIKQRLADINEGKAPLKATDAPSDFRAGVEAREAAAREREAKSRGADVPRWRQDHPVMRQIYRAHDAIVSMPAPGGVAGILLIIFILFLVLIPATTGGETRALMLWEVLLGKKQVPLQQATNAPGSGIAAVGQAGQKATQGQQKDMGSMTALPVQVVSEPAWHIASYTPEGL